MASTKFLNPFTPGVSYKDFLASIPKGKTVAEYCENDLTQSELEFIENELALLESNKQSEADTSEETKE